VYISSKNSFFVARILIRIPIRIRFDPHWFGFIDPDPHRDKKLYPDPTSADPLNCLGPSACLFYFQQDLAQPSSAKICLFIKLLNGAYAFFSRKDVEAQNKLIQQLKKDIEETKRKKKVSPDFF
jgi:hypothetical protein